MSQKIKPQKGFIPIILVIVIAVAVILATAGIVKYKDEITASVSDVFKSKIETSNVKFIEENEAIEESELTEKSIAGEEAETEKKQDNTQQLQEQLRIAEQKRLEAEKQLAEEKAKQEAEKVRAEAERLKQEELSKPQEEARKKAEQDSLLKIEKCKSEYNVRKSVMSTEIEKQLNVVSSLTQDIEKKSFEECTSKGIEQLGIDFSTVSGQVFASYVSLVKQACQRSLDESRKKRLLKFDDLKKSEYSKLEQQLQQEYQQCLNK